jgi:glycosyltransferase involved in cell wall biosynthesis
MQNAIRKQEAGKKEHVSVIIPAFNEEDAVSGQVETIKEVLATHNIAHEILVVDDGSQDRTADFARQAGARVIQHKENLGYGASLKTGIKSALYDKIVIIDSDGTYPADQIPEMLNKLAGADMVVGSRTGNNVHIPLIRKPAKWVLGWLAARIAGRKIPDLNSGLRAFRRNVAKQYFPLLPNGFSFTTTITLAMLADEYSIIFHKINYYKRIGKSKIVPRNFMDFTILVLRMAMLFQPLKIFIPLSVFCGFLGTSKTVFDLILLYQRVTTFGQSTLFSQSIISTSAILLLLVSLQLLLIGMVTDALLRRMTKHDNSLVPSHRILIEESSTAQVAQPDATNRDYDES